ncbi:ATP-binding protein [Chryseolinea sp. T2]|uniref:tetratricopeptide repeat-containing sensor histidine kinase n=1 Tax=Chryseolinea sp. T2 TaxID=3129255 RepID=UPI0030786960
MMSNRVFFVLIALLSVPIGASAQKFDSLALSRKADFAIQNYLSTPDTSLFEARQLLEAAIESRSTYFQANAYYLMAKAHWAKGRLGSSAESGFNALRLLEDSPYNDLKGEVLLSLARTLTELKNYQEASEFLNQAEALAVRTKSSSLQAGVYRERSMLMMERKDYRGSIEIADKGLAIYESNGDTLDASVLYGRKAKAYCALGEFGVSESFNNKAIYLDSLVGNKRGLGIQYYQAAVNAYKLQKFERSNALLKKSLSLLNELGGLGNLIKAHHLQALIFTRQHKTDSAVSEFKLEASLKDSLYNSESIGKYVEMQSAYQLQEKDKAILALEQSKGRQQLITIALSIGIVLLLALIFVLWQLRLIQKRANKDLKSRNLAIEQQKEEMQAQAEKLFELNQLKSKLFSVISHDLRGPISNLHALLSLLTTKAMTADEFISISQKLKTNLNVTQRTLENLLNWSLSQMDGIKTESRSFDVSAVIEEVCNLMSEVAERKHLTFETNGSLPTKVMADLNQVQLILRNLVHNAIKFSKQNSSIRVITSTTASHCIIQIEDHGIGMTTEETEMLQDRPHHFTKVGTHEEKGTGLGLLLCKEFVKRNGGELKIQSTPGKGTTVSFTIPLAEESALVAVPS